MSYMNIKLRFQVVWGPEFLRSARAYVVLIQHCLGRFPQVSNSHPIDLSSSLQ